MIIGKRFALAILLFSGLLGGVAPARARTCAEVDEDARVAQANKDLEALIGFYTEAHDPAAGCSDQHLADFGRDVALGHIDRFVALYSQDNDAARHKQILEQARNYGEPWQLMVTLAGVEADLGNHELAASFYQQAVRDLEMASRSIDTDSAAAENLLTPEEFEMIYGKMTESVLLAQTFSPPTASRGEETGGLFAESYRGYVVREIPVPVQFQFDSIRFTSKGEQVAKYLLEYLLSAHLPKVKLVGHTDAKGADAYNLGLSKRRAEAVRDYLIANGYTGAIEIEGVGESDPFEPVDPESFANDPEAKDQLNRRVELVRNPDA
jgi:outer membrane protein OmpA-like peptidoglycan-associated protein